MKENTHTIYTIHDNYVGAMTGQPDDGLVWTGSQPHDGTIQGARDAVETLKEACPYKGTEETIF